MTARLRQALALLAVAAALAALGAGPAAAASAPQRQLQRELNAIVADRAGPPGIAVVIGRGLHTSFLRAGVADLKTKTPPRINDRIRVGGASAAFGAFLAAGLGGVARPLRLSEPLAGRVPGLLPNAEAVTLEQLLNHSSGLPAFSQDPAYLAARETNPRGYLPPRQLAGFVAAAPLGFAPGSAYAYSDTDNLAIGLMDEAAAGISYEALLSRDAFDPIGMPGSSLPRSARMPGPYLHGYQVEPGRRPLDVSESLNPALAWAAGGIVSTPADLQRFASVYVPTVLPAAKRLPVPFRPGPSSPPGPGRNEAGIGIFQYASRCGSVYGVAGSYPGYRVFLAASPSGNRTVVMVANAAIVPGQGADRVSNAIRRAQVTAVCAALG